MEQNSTTFTNSFSEEAVGRTQFMNETFNLPSWGNVMQSELESFRRISNLETVLRRINLAIAILAVLDNSFVIFILRKSKEIRKKKTNLLILSQSIIDGIGGLAVTMRYVPHRFSSNFISLIYCKVFESRFLLVSTYWSSTYNLMFITLEKYLLIVYPIKHKVWFTKTIIKALIGLSLFLGPIIPLTFVSFYDHNVRSNTCTLGSNFPKALQSFIVFSNLITSGLLPICFIICIYTKIFLVLRARRKNQIGVVVNQEEQADTLSKGEINAFKTMVIVGFCYCICWFPRIVLGLLNFLDINYNIVLNIAITVLNNINFVVNPVIYALKYEPFKKEVRRTLKLRGFCNPAVGPESQVTGSRVPSGTANITHTTSIRSH